MANDGIEVDIGLVASSMFAHERVGDVRETFHR